jgi:hypothetical protein
MRDFWRQAASALPVSAGDRKRTVAAVVVGFGVPDSVPCP